MHSHLTQKLLERKQKRIERQRLGDSVAGNIDITQVGGVRGSLQAMRSRNALKAATSALKEACSSAAELKEDLLLKRGQAGVQKIRESRWAKEDEASMKEGMAELNAMQTSKMRQLELQREAEIEHAHATAKTTPHLDLKLQDILARHERSSKLLHIQMETERLHHKNLLAERIKRRSRNRHEEHERKQMANTIVPTVDIETDLRFAQLELEAAQHEADEQMLKFLASQKAFKEELERETELHHAHISERIQKRRKHRADLEMKKKEQAAAKDPNSPTGMIMRMQALLNGAAKSELTNEGVQALLDQLALVAAPQTKSGEQRAAVKSDNP